MKRDSRLVRLLWIATIVLAFIGVAAGVLRAVRLNLPAQSPRFGDAAGMDSGFIAHKALTLVHIIPGILFMVIGPMQFSTRLRARRLQLHRRLGPVFVVCGAIIGVSALVMSPRMAIGGVNETAATMLFAVVFLFDLRRAYVLIRRRDVIRHREWMIRAFAIGLAVATIRPIVGVFFATRALTHLTPHDFFGTAFWIGFTLHLIAAEAWIGYTRVRPAAVAFPR